MISYARIATPVGNLLLAGTDEALMQIEFEGAGSEASPKTLRPYIRQLEEYFAGKRKVFDVTLAPRGTPFQLAVWNALQKIGYGETRSYSEIARSIGKPDAVRAVGAANGANPIPIIIPCHRVIGANGDLTGFGGGIDVKRRLLDFEAGYRTLQSATIGMRSGSLE